MNIVLRQYHVVCFDGKWRVVRAGARRATKIFSTKDDAIGYLDLRHYSYTVHRRDGTVESKHVGGEAK